MKKLLIIAIFCSVAGCALIPEGKVVDYQWEAKNSNSRNDLDFIPSSGVTIYSGRVDFNNSAQTVVFPLQVAVECNQAKTACKHAIVKHQLEFSAKPASDGGIYVTGRLRAEIGKSLSLNTPSMNMTRSIGDNVEVIAEEKKDISFSKTIKSGETIDLSGFGGVNFDLRVSNAK